MSRGRKDAEARVTEASRMEFRVRDRAGDVISEARAEAKVQEKAGAGDKGKEDVREWGGIGIKKARQKKFVVEDEKIEEEFRGDKGVLLEVATAATSAVLEG